MESNIKARIETLKNRLRSFKSLGTDSKEFHMGEFQRFIEALKTEIADIRNEINRKDIRDQLDSILHYRTIIETDPLKQFFIRFFAPSHYGRLGLNWNKKGKYIFDLDQLDLKLSGALYKLKNTPI